jgi:hypothetical protein
MKTLLILGILALSTFSFAELKDRKGADSKPGTTTPFDFDYEFARPVRNDEMTYNKYRAEHAEWAAKHMGLSADAVSDGMDTWHWWVGVDNPGFWQDLVNLSGGPNNLTDLRIDFFRLVITITRDERFKKFGLIIQSQSKLRTNSD